MTVTQLLDEIDRISYEYYYVKDVDSFFTVRGRYDYPNSELLSELSNEDYNKVLAILSHYCPRVSCGFIRDLREEEALKNEARTIL